MKKVMVFLTIVFLAAALAMPSSGAEQSMPGTATRQQQPFIQVSPMPAGKPDLVITMGGHGSVYKIGERAGITEYAVNVEFTIKNIGQVATGSAGNTFSVGTVYTPLCQAPDCNAPAQNIAQACAAITCAKLVADATKSFHFSPPITISPPLTAGESRTIMGLLVLPQCLQWSTLGGNVSVSFIVDDMNQVNESKEYNNKSTPLSVTSFHY